jgi:hypothetical protein
MFVGGIGTLDCIEGGGLKPLRGLAESSKQDDHGYDTAKND